MIIRNKKKDLKNLQKIVLNLKKNRKTIAFTNGCFDLIHPGHIKLFKTAKKKADLLIVGLNSDKSIKIIKGKKRPILCQNARIKILAAIEYIDYLILFNQKTPLQLIKKLKPNILIKGSDWKKNQIVGHNLVDEVIRVQTKPGYSTTNIIKKIRKDG